MVFMPARTQWMCLGITLQIKADIARLNRAGLLAEVKTKSRAAKFAFNARLD